MLKDIATEKIVSAYYTKNNYTNNVNFFETAAASAWIIFNCYLLSTRFYIWSGFLCIFIVRINFKLDKTLQNVPVIINLLMYFLCMWKNSVCLLFFFCCVLVLRNKI